jgi:hypothetical protein
MLIDPPTTERQTGTDVPKELMTPSTPHEVADAVADDRTGDGRHDDGPKRHSSVEGKHASKECRDLSGEQEPKERGRFQGRHPEHDRQGERPVQ